MRRLRRIKYIAKKDSWFDEGEEIELIDDYRPDMDCGLFKGPKTVDSKSNHQWDELHSDKVGETLIDEEICPFDEFKEVVEG